ncbi:fungal class II heme-containing peroxidase [Stylosanthes scabra]|uniref:Fungal class II heme-containing peroxidase n=1 Tax=Stylosanthes scabra TaxID=79078 RepID=A0ABU6ZNQ5_9FABA|nr:fungal class II heme-containing peroxidase [Stylosanthes scabra]
MSNLFLFILILSSSLTVVFSGGGDKNPFTPKAYALRYWDKAIQNTLPKPSFLVSKASPLTAIQAAKYAKLAATNSLTERLPEFCSAAHLLCFPDIAPNLSKRDKSQSFTGYDDGQNFTSYGIGGAGSQNDFKNYSNGFFNPGVNEFRSYSRSSGGGSETFTGYGEGNNVVEERFNTYGKLSGGGTGKFTEYATDSNVPNLRFSSYGEETGGRQESFSKYSDDGNAGDQTFSNYGKSSAGAVSEFDSYGNNSNVASSTFSSYGGEGAGENETFTNYGINENVPEENFKNYGSGTTGGTQTFANYRDQANVGDTSFTSYDKESNNGSATFSNYGQSFNEGTDTFKGYAQNSTGTAGFKEYGVNTTFKEYRKDGASFSSYTKATSSSAHASASLPKKWVEPGKFFRESMLKEGTIMPMPDIKDKMPKRSFLPRSILTKLPFSTSELKRIFKASDESSMDKMIKDSMGECTRAPSAGETKRCVGSVEDMIDFATSVLGRDITVRSTENVNGSKKNVMVSKVKGINGGKVTESVSCHQSLFPYLLYYCHSVPKVRVYEADLLDPNTKAKINHGVAICHLDTTAWSSTHGAFLALGSGPGKIEVCHWIFENDMTWTIAN